ncbi:MAG TPA: hypothetical protein VJ740_15045 [Hyphomicrobiaceae bacterium]|jgi:hypothetical protein|nr:hypothetical protein [Hyphomicrobiaceae bacterium]
MSRTIRVVVAVAAVAMLAGCADGDGYGGDPGAVPLASGQSCGTIRSELDALDRKGTQAKVEAASAGKKLSPKDKGDVDRYNTLLNQYLGARCHA